MMRFVDTSSFAERLVCSTLSGRSIRFEDIRKEDARPGLREEEIVLLRLIESLSNGCLVELHATGLRRRAAKNGTPLHRVLLQAWSDHGRPHPSSAHHDTKSLLLFATPHCSWPLWKKSERISLRLTQEPTALGWFFQKLTATLEGITHDDRDTSVDILRSVTLPLVSRLCGIDDDGLELKVIRRGAAPDGGGQVGDRGRMGWLSRPWRDF